MLLCLLGWCSDCLDRRALEQQPADCLPYRLVGLGLTLPGLAGLHLATGGWCDSKPVNAEPCRGQASFVETGPLLLMDTVWPLLANPVSGQRAPRSRFLVIFATFTEFDWLPPSTK